MKQTITLSLFICTAFCCVISSCKRKENIETIQTRLTHSWKLSKIATDDNGNNGIDASEIHPLANGSDDRIVFNTNNTGNQTVIAANGVQTDFAFTWSLGAGDTITRIGIGSNIIKYHVEDISTTTLELSTMSEQNILCGYYYVRY